MTEMILGEIPVKEDFGSDALFILPCKASEAYQPWRLLSDGETRTTLAQAMRSQIVKTQTGFEYDVHCLGIAVVDDTGKNLNKTLIDNSFNHIYFYLGTGQYNKLVIPPIDSTLSPEVQQYLKEKYQALKLFLENPDQTNEFFEKGKRAGANNPITKQLQTPDIAIRYYERQKGNLQGFVKNFANNVSTLGVDIIAPVIFVPRKPEKPVEEGVEKPSEQKPGFKK